MFDKCVVDPSITRFDMEYPERWANILELRAIPDRMIICFPNLQKVYIKTHSVYIIQCVHSQHIGIIDKAEKYPEKDYRDLKIRYCDEPDKFEGLWSMSATKFEKVT